LRSGAEQNQAQKQGFDVGEAGEQRELIGDKTGPPKARVHNQERQSEDHHRGEAETACS